LKLNTNHVISKRIVETHPLSLIGLEDLTGIRERTKRRKKRRKGKKLLLVSVKARKANRHASQWAFAELHDVLAYKAVLAGSLCVQVEAAYTSQQCPRCGLTSPENRPDKGLLFACQRCHYTLHADLIGARNIALRTLLVRQDWTSTGTLSGCLDVTDDEAKARRRQRYLELRWSPVTSSSPLGDMSS
jgi:IS605 OrfB family transposase